MTVAQYDRIALVATEWGYKDKAQFGTLTGSGLPLLWTSDTTKAMLAEAKAKKIPHEAADQIMQRQYIAARNGVI